MRGQRTRCQGVKPAGEVACGTSLTGAHAFSLKVSDYRMGHETGGKDPHTCRSPRPTAVVSLGSPGHCVHWPLRLKRETPSFRESCPPAPQRDQFSLFAPLAQAGAGHGLLAWIFGSSAR